MGLLQTQDRKGDAKTIHSAMALIIFTILHFRQLPNKQINFSHADEKLARNGTMNVHSLLCSFRLLKKINIFFLTE